MFIIRTLASRLPCPSIAVRRALRTASVVTCALIVAVGGLAAAPSHAAPSRADITVHGTVFSTTGSAVPFATVFMENTSVMANSAGQYSVAVRTTGDAMVHIWAPGYRDAIYTLHLPTSVASVGWNFSSGFALQSAFSDPPTYGTLSGLPVNIGASTRSVHFHGSANAPVQRTFVVELPDGHVKRYKLTVHGAAFSGTLPVGAPGAFRVEINNRVGISVFDVLVFHGVKPALPLDLPVPADLPGATLGQLESVALNSINTVRLGLHLPNLSMQPNLRRAARSHTTDIIRGGYMYTHPHIGSDGSTMRQRIARAGFPSAHVAEDVVSAENMRMAVVSLLTSPMHRANIIGNYRYVGLGVGRTGSSYVVTIDFVP